MAIECNPTGQHAVSLLRPPGGISSFRSVSVVTIMGWAQADRLPTDSVNQYAVAGLAGGTPAPPGLSGDARAEFFINPTGGIHVSSRPADAPGPVATESPVSYVTPGLIYHLATIFDFGNNLLHYYVNGVYRNSKTVSFNAAVTSNTNSSNGAIGADEKASDGDVFNGRLEDIRFYNRGLTPAEIQTIFACEGVDGIVQGLQDRFALDDQPAGTVITPGSVRDSGIQGAHGTNQNSPTFKLALKTTSRRRMP